MKPRLFHIIVCRRHCGGKDYGVIAEGKGRAANTFSKLRTRRFEESVRRDDSDDSSLSSNANVASARAAELAVGRLGSA